MAGGKTFEIGLVGAGAISAGAYTGGVVDFMVHALDTWYAAKADGDPLAPPHDVLLSVFSGASAGAMTAALSAAYLCSDQPAIGSPAEALRSKGRNKLFDSWVERIDIAPLLKTQDLQSWRAPVVSLLDSTVLSRIADTGLQVTPRALRRPYVAPHFALMMTVTNLRGVPYGFKLDAGRDSFYEMTLHADYLQFSLSDDGAAASPDSYAMSWSAFGAGVSEVKEKLKASALASGAFPFALAPRTLEHEISAQPDWYSARTWPVPSPDSHAPHVCVKLESIAARWGHVQGPFSYAFPCVDGGVMDNEPLELARRHLAASDSGAAHKTVLMIAPFPSEAAFKADYTPPTDILGVAWALFGAMKQQARFKPEELMQAARADNSTHYMIAPSRDGEQYAIACGSLEGFGGFLKRDFREHDYFLARRNAQKFFRDHFVLPETDALFDAWSSAMRERFFVRDQDGQAVLRKGQRLLPVIPLMGDASVDCPTPLWPSYSEADLRALRMALQGRMRVVISRLLGHYFWHTPIQWALVSLIVRLKVPGMAKWLVRGVRDELTKMKLMR